MIQLRAFQPGSGPWITLLATFRMLATGEAVARLLGLAVVVLLARNLDPAGFGLISLGLTLVLWFALVVDWGSEVLALRDVARNPARLRELVEPVLGMRLLICLPASALFLAFAWVLPATTGDRAVLGLFALVLPAMALNLRWMVLGVGASKAVAVGSVAGQLVLAVGVLALVGGVHETRVVPLLYAAAELTAAAIVFGAVVRRFGRIRPRIDKPAWIRALGAGSPVLINNVARTAVYSFDVMLAAILLGRTAVGYYSAAYKPVMFVVGALAIFYVSFLASYSPADPSDADQVFRRSVLATLGLALAVAAATSIGSGTAIDLVYGDAYGPAAGVLAILIWSIPLLGVSGAYAGALIAAGRQDRLMRNNVVGAAANVALNAVALPLAGIRGAAAVTVASEALILTLNARAVTRLRLQPGPLELLRAFLREHLVLADATASKER